MKLLAGVAFFTLVGCSTGPEPQQRKAQATFIKTSEEILRDKVQRLATQYSSNPESADNIARAVVSECDREIRDLVDRHVDRFQLDVTGTKNQKTAKIEDFRREKESTIRQVCLDNAIGTVVRIRGDRPSAGKQ